jgi:hypothetical protein
MMGEHLSSARRLHHIRPVADTPALSAAVADRYHVDHEIGRGGMAVVYLADDLRHHRKVAIKLLHPDLAQAVGPTRFLREIAIAAQLTHPHIVPLYDSGELDGRLFYVMPISRANRCARSSIASSSFPSTRRCPSRARSPRPSSTRTRATSSIATSSRRTSSSIRAKRWSPTSASRSP